MHTATYTLVSPKPGNVQILKSTEGSQKLAENVGIVKALSEASWLAYIYGRCEVRREGQPTLCVIVNPLRHDFTAKGFDGTYKLVRQNGMPVAIGDTVDDHHGKTYTVSGGTAPTSRAPRARSPVPTAPASSTPPPSISAGSGWSSP